MSTADQRRPTGGGGARRLVLMVMCVGNLLVLLDVTVINLALPQIGAGLGASVSGMQRPMAGGTIGDLDGHKPVVLTGLTVFGTASLACGMPSTTGALIAGHVRAGLHAVALVTAVPFIRAAVGAGLVIPGHTRDPVAA